MSTIVHSTIGDLPVMILSQVWSRVVTFVLNVSVIRAVDGAVFGAFSVELLLVLTVSVFLTREGLRSVTGRADSSRADLRRTFWLSALVSLALGSVVCALVHAAARAAAFDSALVESGVWSVSPLTVTSVAALLELCGEPFYALLQARLLIGRRVRVNGLATLTRCLAVYLFAVRLRWGLMAFALGEIVKSLTDSLGFAYVAWSHGLLAELGDWREARDVVRDALRRDATLLAMFYWQAVQKLVLTEAEKIALWLGASLYSQGTYSIVGNLGSLVARLW